jgi:hypothetical protein
MLPAAVALCVVGTAAQSRDDRERDATSVEREFAAGGRIRMDLSAGEYVIRGTDSERIRVQWRSKHGYRRGDADVDLDVRGRDATIVTDGPDDQFEVRIDVPSRSHLFARLTAGELSIEGLHGDKDVELHAGELHIDVGRPEDYRTVEGGVWAGEVTASPFGIAKGGLFRSFSWRGDGSYRLHAKLKAGEIRLYSTRAPR